MNETQQSLTSTQLKYLLAIYDLTESSGVRVTRLSQKMGVSKPTAHRILALFREFGLLESAENGVSRLTFAGEKAAAYYLRQYHLLCDFFCGELALDAPSSSDAALTLLGSAYSSQLCQRVTEYYRQKAERS